MNVKQMELDANGEKPKFNDEGQEMLYFEKEDEIEFWNLIQNVKKAKGDVNVLIDEIRQKPFQSAVKMDTWFNNFAVRLSRIIEKEKEISDRISEQDYAGFIDHLIFLGKEKVAEIILGNGEILKSDDGLFWDKTGKPWQFYIWDKTTKRRYYWVGVVPKEIESMKK